MKYSESFLLHIRPRYYRAGSLRFSATFYLGFLCVFLFALECITGVVLMVYYAPTPEEAYGTIIRLSTEVPFGALLRDLHRLGGEVMIIATLLHMAKVFYNGSFTGKYAITWITGVFMLLLTLFLAFSGYLLPWDQLAFWAVTIGTSMAETIPLIGAPLTEMLRGGPVMGQDGLLRFYLLHVIGLPLILSILLAVHYFRVVRIHPVGSSSRRHAGADVVPVAPPPGRVSFFPRVALIETTLSLALIVVLVGIAAFVYDAPLENHANPRHTPSETTAPWFFLWLQGALKLGDSFLMGVCFPTVLLLVLVMLPFLPSIFPAIRTGARLSPISSALIIGLTVVALSTLTSFGLPRYGVEQGPVHQLFQNYMPEEGISAFHRIGYSHLSQGIFDISAGAGAHNAGDEFNDLIVSLHDDISALAASTSFKGARSILIIEDWQSGLKRVTLRVSWPLEPGSTKLTSEERVLFVHRLDTEQITKQTS